MNDFRTRVRDALMPTTVTRWVKITAWALLISNIGIVGTGGLVRLTGSGMGCPTWPTCTPESLIPTAELSAHSLIEFGNRTLTGVLVVIAAFAFLAVIRQRHERPAPARLTFIVGLGIILQALIGGITVWMHLHPSVVGVHYFVSAGLVAVSTANLVLVYAPPSARRLAVPRRYAILTHLTTFAVTVTVIVGIILTGAGPHAGDDSAARNGLDPSFWQHVHSWPGYVTFLLTIGLVLGSLRTPKVLNLTRWTSLLLGIEIIQIIVGVWQARTGLPIALVNIHMVLAVCLVAAMTAVVMNLKAPVATLTPTDPRAPETVAAR